MVEKPSKDTKPGTVPRPRHSVMNRLLDAINLRAQIKRLSNEAAEYRHAYETTARDRDRLLGELSRLRELTADDVVVNAGSLAPRATEGRPTLPSMFFVTTPKSGTLYLMRLFTLGLGLRYMQTSLNGFPTDSLDLPKVKAVCAGNCYSMAHLDPSATNLQMLDHFFGQFVLHVRDPRQALWSWYHHIEKLLDQGEEESLLRVAPMIPRGYVNWPISCKLEWQISNHLPNLVRWTENWLSIYDEKKYDILLCDYEYLVSDAVGYVDCVLKYLKIEESEFQSPSIKKSDEIHFRSGDPGEWRKDLPLELVENVNAAVPDAILDRMNWTR